MKDADPRWKVDLLTTPNKHFVHEHLLLENEPIDWYYVDTGDSVMVLPLTGSGSVVLVRQYRHNLKRYTLELPSGRINDGEAAEIAAIRELKEETGYELSGGTMEPLGRFYVLPSETNKYVFLFLARPVEKRGPASRDNQIERHFDMSVVELPLPLALSQIGTELDGIETVGALMLANLRLQKP